MIRGVGQMPKWLKGRVTHIGRGSGVQIEE